MCLKNIIFNKINGPLVILCNKKPLDVDSEQRVMEMDFCKRKFIF